MPDLVFSDYTHPPVVFDALMATPDMLPSKKFCAVTINGATDCMLPNNVYTALEKDVDIFAFALKFPGEVVLPLSVPVKRSKLMPLYRSLLSQNVPLSTVLGWFGTDPRTVEELVAAVGGDK